MKTLLKLCLFACLAVVTLKGQTINLERIKAADTLYIAFDETNERFKKQKLNLKQVDTRYTYYFKGENKGYFQFSHAPMLDYDYKADVQYVSSYFFNDKVLIDASFFNETTINRAWGVIKNKQAYYVIDEQEKQGNQLIVKQVQFYSTFENTQDLDVKCIHKN